LPVARRWRPSPKRRLRPSLRLRKAAVVESGPAGGVVQIAAYTSESAAVAGWNRLVQGHEMLKGMNHRIVSAKIDLGTVYRLQLVTNAGAGRACASG
jgi:methylglyoxal synthase